MTASNARYHEAYLAASPYYRHLLDTYGDTMTDLEVTREAEAHGVTDLGICDMATLDFVIELGY